MRASLFLLAGQGHAQAESETVRVAWAEIAPIFVAGADGAPAGFGAAVMRMIAQEAGLSVDFVKYDSPEEMVRAQANGETDLLPGVAALPLLSEANLFSDPVAATSIRLFVRAEDASDLAQRPIEGLRIAAPSLSLGPDGDRLLARNVSVQLAVGSPMLLALLSGTIDGFLASDVVTLVDAAQARLDHRLVAIGAPLDTLDRVVAIARDKAHLLAPINAAIARLEASGALKTIRYETRIVPPPPVPEELVVGVYHFPPFNIVTPEGTFRGFSVDAFRDLARIAGLTVRFIEITREEWAAGPGPGTYDIIAQLAISDDRRQRMDFSAVVERSSHEVFVPSDNPLEIRTPDDLQGLRVGVEEVNRGRRAAEARGGMQLVVYQGQTDLIQALLDREVDAIIYPKRVVYAQAEALGRRNDLVALSTPFEVSDRAIALRFGLAEIRERLNAVLPAYLASPRYQTLRNQYFEPYSFWTSDRIRKVITGLGLLLALACLLFAAILFYRRERAIWERRRFAAALIEDLPLSMVLVSPDGTIDFMDLATKARLNLPPGGKVEGQPYRDVIAEGVRNGTIQSADHTPEALEKLLTEDAMVDGSRIVQRLPSGEIIERTTRRLDTGAYLLARRDITLETKRLDKLERMRAELETQVGIAKGANEDLQAFAYATSHDLRTPANTLLQLAEALADYVSDTDEDAREIATDVSVTARRMLRIIEDVREYTATIASEEVVAEKVDLDGLVDSVLQDLASELDASATKVTRAKLGHVHANPAQLRMLLRNLIGNANKFRSRHRKPEIKIDALGDQDGSDCAQISISDNGIGIAPKHASKIFKAFSRMHTFQEYQGTGLGLAVCKRIAQNHGGTIEVASQQGRGATFVVSIPKRPRAAPAIRHS
ncbi:MAG: transporter substrate-binding domain-containing protein [Pseudomonadota bacterium]